ncbi:MAG: hypothetical protein J0I80_12315 [Sphingomonas sp.]|nr:hypothetical protein [Sphingomonas sp.]
MLRDEQIALLRAAFAPSSACKAVHGRTARAVGVRIAAHRYPYRDHAAPRALQLAMRERAA